MPGSQSFTPRPVRPSRPKRRFTLSQANSALPLVRRIVGDIVKTHGLILRLQAEMDQASGREQATAQGHLDESVGRLEDFVDELSEVGCELKDYQVGLIDFIGRHESRDVYLCWKLGEEQIAYWHELNAGFGGRQPIATLKETN